MVCCAWAMLWLHHQGVGGREHTQSDVPCVPLVVSILTTLKWVQRVDPNRPPFERAKTFRGSETEHCLAKGVGHFGAIHSHQKTFLEGRRGISIVHRTVHIAR